MYYIIFNYLKRGLIMDETYQFVNTLLYESDEGAVSINVVIDKDNETMWATQKTMAELFNVDRSVLQNI